MSNSARGLPESTDKKGRKPETQATKKGLFQIKLEHTERPQIAIKSLEIEESKGISGKLRASSGRGRSPYADATGDERQDPLDLLAELEDELAVEKEEKPALLHHAITGHSRASQAMYIELPAFLKG